MTTIPEIVRHEHPVTLIEELVLWSGYRRSLRVRDIRTDLEVAKMSKSFNLAVI